MELKPNYSTMKSNLAFAVEQTHLITCVAKEKDMVRIYQGGYTSSRKAYIKED